jgi:hypothetical protein
MLGACDTIKSLFPHHPDKKTLLKKAFPYLSDIDLDYWISFFKLV